MPTFAPPEGTRFILPDETAYRASFIASLQNLYDRWAYERVDTPVLEHYDPEHSRLQQSFKLSDRDSGVLMLRSDFTPAIARLVQGHYAGHEGPLRFQYCGKVWHAVKPDIARTREFTQIGLELVGISNARADAELIHLARESIRVVGLTPRVEIGNPGFVRALFDLAAIPETAREAIANAIDHKDQSSLEALLESLEMSSQLRHALLSVPDLYGDVSILKEAHTLAPWPETRLELDRLDTILAEFEDNSELLLDLGMARRLSYYTSMTFQAYTFDFGQALLGGGRYDGALLPYAAGFTLGLERLLAALPEAPRAATPLVLTLDDIPARQLRKAGFVVERALSLNLDEARAYAKTRGIPYLLSESGLEPLLAETPFQHELQSLLDTAPLEKSHA
jgi:ATP phosphoribosyltransferase regulatory subunit